MNKRLFSVVLIFFMLTLGIYVIKYKNHNQFSVLENRNLAAIERFSLNS